jgi:hypothetical protein
VGNGLDRRGFDCYLLGFSPEDGGDMFLRKFGLTYVPHGVISHNTKCSITAAEITSNPTDVMSSELTRQKKIR